MFECEVYVHLPLDQYPDIKIASYDYDPGLSVGDIVWVEDIEWFYGHRVPKKSFEAKVTICRKVIKPKNCDCKGTLFKLRIGIEIADKEILPELKEILEKDNT